MPLSWMTPYILIYGRSFSGLHELLPLLKP